MVTCWWRAAGSGVCRRMSGVGSACHPCVSRQLPVSAWQRPAWPRGDAAAASPYMVIAVAASCPGGWQQVSDGGDKGQGGDRRVKRRCLHAHGGCVAGAVGRRGAHRAPPRGWQGNVTAAVPPPPPLNVPMHPRRTSRVGERVRREEGSPQRGHRWGSCGLARLTAQPQAMEATARRSWALGECGATGALGRNGTVVRAGDPLCDCSCSLARFRVVPAMPD